MNDRDQRGPFISGNLHGCEWVALYAVARASLLMGGHPDAVTLYLDRACRRIELILGQAGVVIKGIPPLIGNQPPLRVSRGFE